MEREDLRLDPMDPKVDGGPGRPRRKTPERRLLWLRIRLLLGCLITTPSADVTVDELLVDVPDLKKEEESR